MGDRVSATADVRCNRVKGDSQKYIIHVGYIANTRKENRNTKFDYIKVSILGLFFILSSFLTTKP
jgi:hypothetical protein